MDSENGRMTREEYRAQMGLDAEPNTKREKSGDAGARLILLQLIICAARIVKYIIIKIFYYIKSLTSPIKKLIFPTHTII